MKKINNYLFVYGRLWGGNDCSHTYPISAEQAQDLRSGNLSPKRIATDFEYLVKATLVQETTTVVTEYQDLEVPR